MWDNQEYYMPVLGIKGKPGEDVGQPDYYMAVHT